MYARSLVEKGHFDFKCPHVDQRGKSDCPRVWEWFMVRHVAALSSMEMQEYEAMLGKLSDRVGLPSTFFTAAVRQLAVPSLRVILIYLCPPF